MSDYVENNRDNGWREFPPLIPTLPPIYGRWYYVNPSLGSSGGSGKNPNDPMDSIVTAYTACTDGAGDGIVLFSYGTGATASTTSYISSTLTWAKNDITVVGSCAPVKYGKRTRVTNKSTATTLTPAISITGTNNYFKNIQFSNFASGAAVYQCVVISGYRNCFENCEFIMGGGGINNASASSLALVGAQECSFYHCIMGSDTTDQGSGVVSGVISLASGCERNFFEDCDILSMLSGGSNVGGAILAAGLGDAITRNNTFSKCRFQNYVNGSPDGSAGASDLVVGTAPNNGVILLHDCATVGFTAICAWTQRCYIQCGPTQVAGGPISIKSA